MSVTSVRSERLQETELKWSVVIVAPDEDGGRDVADRLRETDSFLATVVGYGAATIHALERLRPQLILLAISRDERQGLAACERLRLDTDTPIVICSRNDNEQAIVRAFNAGADEYLVLPMQPGSLMARLRAVMRRAADWPGAAESQAVLTAGSFEVRVDERRVLKDGRSIDLSPIEFRLLEVLMRHSGQLLTHNQLLAEVWGPQYVDSRNYLRLYIQYLREKIEDDARHPRFLVNEWGVGYRFEPGEAGVLPGAPRVAA